MQALCYDFVMNKRTKISGPKCPITFGLDIFGDKWSLIIIRDIVFKGKRSYREFLTSPEKISTNILASRLKQLEANGILSKAKDAHNQSKFVYSLTDKGKDLVPLLLEIVRWGAKYDPQPDAPDSIISGAPSRLLDQLASDRDAVIQQILKGL